MADFEAGYVEDLQLPTPKRTRLTDSQLAEAEAAITAAKGRSLTRILSHYDSLSNRASAKGVTLDTAIAFFDSHYREEVKSVTIYNAYREFLDAKTDLSPKTLIHYTSSLKTLLSPDPNRPLTDVTLSDIERILKGFKNLNSRQTMRRALSAFFSWAVRHHYCLENPCDRLDKQPRDMSRISVLSLEECQRLLHAALLLHDGAAAASVAIGLFAGLRPSEIRDLKPDDIAREKIRVSGGKLRRKLKRTTPIPPVLAAWLELHPFTGFPSGWDGKLKTLKKATKAKSWVQDVIRHTSITFQAERDKSEAGTAFNNGTSIEMMNRHYREIIDDDDTVRKFWNLTPAEILSAKPEVEIPNRHRFDWPSKGRLKKLVWQKPLIHAAKDLEVSDVALRNHCKKVGVELPPRGHWIKKNRND